MTGGRDHQDGKTPPEREPVALEIELDLGPSESPVSRIRKAPAMPSRHDDADDDVGERIGGIGGIDLATDALDPPKSGIRRPPASLPGGALSEKSRRISVTRHASSHPKVALVLSLGSALVVMLVLATPHFSRHGVLRVTELLGRAAPAPFAALGVVALGAWAFVFGRALRDASPALHLASVGLVVEMIASMLVVAALVRNSPTARAFQTVMPVVVPLATACVALGLAVSAAVRAVDELRGSDRRVHVSALLFLFALAGCGLGVRVARVDLPLPVYGESLDIPLWAPLE